MCDSQGVCSLFCLFVLQGFVARHRTHTHTHAQVSGIAARLKCMDLPTVKNFSCSTGSIPIKYQIGLLFSSLCLLLCCLTTACGPEFLRSLLSPPTLSDSDIPSFYTSFNLYSHTNIFEAMVQQCILMTIPVGMLRPTYCILRYWQFFILYLPLSSCVQLLLFFAFMEKVMEKVCKWSFHWLRKVHMTKCHQVAALYLPNSMYVRWCCNSGLGSVT